MQRPFDAGPVIEAELADVIDDVLDVLFGHLALAQRQGELMQPLLDRVQTAIDKVAKAKNLDLVLRSQVGSEPVLLFVNEDTIMNITLDVARELGIDVGDEPTASGAN